MAKTPVDRDDERDKLLLLAAALYAVRLFRSPLTEHRPDGDRDLEAKRAALDAKSLLSAVNDVMS